MSFRPQVLAPFNKEINVNKKVKDLYIEHLLPKMAAVGDDNNYGSSAMYDVLALQVGLISIMTINKSLQNSKAVQLTEKLVRLFHALLLHGPHSLETSPAGKRGASE